MHLLPYSLNLSLLSFETQFHKTSFATDEWHERTQLLLCTLTYTKVSDNGSSTFSDPKIFLYTEKYKISHVSEKLIFFIYPTQRNLRIQCNPYQNSSVTFERNRKKHQKIVEPQKKRNHARHSNLIKKNKAEGITSAFKRYYKYIITKTM
jgi:hypothetical protein